MEIEAQDKPKIELKDILAFTLNTDNLQKYLDFFINTDNYLKKEVNDTKIRLDRVEENQKVTAEILFRLNVSEKKIDEIYKTMNSFQAKIMDFENKLSKIDEVNKTNLKNIFFGNNLNRINFFALLINYFLFDRYQQKLMI